MKIKVLKSKIHNATVTGHNVDYDGSIGIDVGLIEAGNFSVYEKVHVLNLDNGRRLETYIVGEARGSNNICIYGAAAHLIQSGQRVIILSYGSLLKELAIDHKPTILHLDKNNEIKD